MSFTPLPNFYPGTLNGYVPAKRNYLLEQVIRTGGDVIGEALSAWLSDKLMSEKERELHQAELDEIVSRTNLNREQTRGLGIDNKFSDETLEDRIYRFALENGLIEANTDNVISRTELTDNQARSAGSKANVDEATENERIEREGLANKGMEADVGLTKAQAEAEKARMHAIAGQTARDNYDAIRTINERDADLKATTDYRIASAKQLEEAAEAQRLANWSANRDRVGNVVGGDADFPFNESKDTPRLMWLQAEENVGPDASELEVTREYNKLMGSIEPPSDEPSTPDGALNNFLESVAEGGRAQVANTFAPAVAGAALRNAADKMKKSHDNKVDDEEASAIMENLKSFLDL